MQTQDSCVKAGGELGLWSTKLTSWCGECQAGADAVPCVLLPHELG